MTMWRGVTIAVLAFLAAGCGSAPPAQAGPLKDSAERKIAADFTLRDANGKPVRLSSYKGKVVLLNFWATWCGPCKVEVPWFVEFQRKYKDQGFTVLGVTVDEETWVPVMEFLKEQRVNYPVVMSDEQVVSAYGGVESLPMTFLIDRQGRIAAQHEGLVSKGDYESEIQSVLGAAAGQPAPRVAK